MLTPILRPILQPVLVPVDYEYGDVFNPLSLFAGGTQGFWYDPSDFSTLFQDASGTTPVTAVGQPVGLVLDKSKGLVLGPELLTNGDFSDGATGWGLAGEDATHILTFSDGKMRYQSGATTPVLSITQSNILAAGKSYKITAVCSQHTSGSVKMGEAAGASGSLVVSGVGTFTAVITYTGLSSFQVLRNGASVDLTLDSLSIKELPGNHAYQKTALSRPTLQQDSTGRYYLSFDGTDDGMATPSIDFTGTDKLTLWAGVRKPSDGATMCIAELSALTGPNPGSFILFNGKADGSAGAAFTFRSFGTAQASAATPLNYTSPVSAVLTGQSDIAGDICRIRGNNDSPVTATNDQGTGNYGNYPLYIGRRAGTSLPFNGRIYQLIGRGAETPLAQIVAMEQYVNVKTGAY